MKKLIVLTLSIVLAISLSSCATTPKEETQADSTPAEATPAEATQADGATFKTEPIEEENKMESTPTEDTRRDSRRVIRVEKVRPNAFTECGIGAAIFNNQYWNLWPLASTGNLIWDFGLTGSSSATTTPETCAGVRVETAKLILGTLPGLEKDIALGEGKHLSALHETIGCNIGDQGKINSSLRFSYAEIVNDESYETKSKIQRASDLYDIVRAVTLSYDGSCKAVL